MPGLSRFGSRAPAANGSALLTTLFAVVMMTVILVAFLKSTTLERQASRSYFERYRATLAANAGANWAMNQLRQLFERCPDSCTAWADFGATMGTVYYYHGRIANDKTYDGALPSETRAGIVGVPLISGATARVRGDILNAFGVALDATNSTDLNRDAWIGRLPGTPLREIRAKWVEILQDPSLPKDLSIDPATKRPRNPPVARYAFWVEDESFRVNVNTATGAPRGQDSLGNDASEVTMPAAFAAAPTTLGDEVVNLRVSLPESKFLSGAQVRYAKTIQDSDYESVKYLTTIHSSSLNVSRGGFKRLNLNTAIEDTNVPAKIRAQLDRIIVAMKNPRAVPDFGQRFYSHDKTPSFGTSDVTHTTSGTPNTDIYLTKLAANIRDYIDTDSQPTVVRSDGTVQDSRKPDIPDSFAFAITGNNAGPNAALAIGKEALPALQEHAFRIKLIAMDPERTSDNHGAGSRYHFEFDHYFEFANLSQKPIYLADLGPNPFILIYDNFGWRTDGGDDIPPGRPIELPLSQLVNEAGEAIRIAAGGVAVLTTDSDPVGSLTPNKASVFRPTPVALAKIQAERVFKGVTKASTGSYYQLSANVGSRDGRAGTAFTDYGTAVMVGNDLGILESFSGLGLALAVSIDNENDAIRDKDRYIFRASSLRGNKTASNLYQQSQTGDARSLNEQLYIQRYRTGGDIDQTRFFSSHPNNNAFPLASSFGSYGSDFLVLENWPDYATTAVTDADNVPSIIANAKLRSIGELGNVYDPARLLLQRDETGVRYSRGGGRTLKIGQPDALPATASSATYVAQWDGAWTSASRNRAAWRLADIFAVTDELQREGLINVNGVVRDGGAAFRAVVSGLVFHRKPASDPQLANRTLQETALVTALNNRIKSGSESGPDSINPIWERGELSELSVFNQGNSLAGISMETTLDRGREELFRRAVEMITTKGNTFSVYIKGESLRSDSSGRVRVAGTVRKRVTFRLKPVFDPALPADNSFDGATELAVSDGIRFRRPNRYEIEILSESQP